MKRAVMFVALVGLLALFSLTAPVAFAAFSVNGTGLAGAAAATMPAGGQPVGSATGSSVTIRWPAATLSNGTPVAGYVISRFNASNGSSATVGANCSAVVTTTSCTEQGVPPGSWLYTDTPVQLSWTGSQSPPSLPIVVT